jgi:hypothetical protein
MRVFFEKKIMQHQLSKVLKKNFFVVLKNSFLHFYWCVHFFGPRRASLSRAVLCFIHFD